ncbi:PH domain-containing protein [Halalkalibacterium halodurans]|uniref:PH domain-containing protein n=1 Tax=Halalkalibacterium halodurans TaxID=86665 RepID=UPI002E202CBD|nr:PH domain-containing protein [Halalkalibacterium halodurans]
MNELKRLHPASMLVSFMISLRGMLVPLVVSFFLGTSATGFQFQYIFYGLLIFSFLSGVLDWITFRYRLSEHELYVQRGILIRKKRYIQKHRVQSIDVTAGIFQRLFGLVKVKIETAGGGAEPEVELLAITKREAQFLREQLLEKRQLLETEWLDDSDEDEKEKVASTIPLFTLGKTRLWIAAITSSGIGLTLSAIGALYSQLQQFIPDTVYEQTFGWFTASSVWLVVIVAFTLTVIAWVLSILATMSKYWNHQVQAAKQGRELIITRGLLETRQLTLQTKRVTAVRLVSNLFRQPFGYTSVYVESKGGGSSDEQLSTVLFPLVRKSEVNGLLAKCLPEYQLEDQSIIPIPKRALFRFLIRTVSLPVIVTALLFTFTDYGWIGIVLILLAVWLGYSQYKVAGYFYREDTLVFRYRQLSQVHVIVPKRKIQMFEVATSVFQQRLRLCSPLVSVQSSIVGKTFSVRDLDRKDGNRLLAWFSIEQPSVSFSDRTPERATD